MLGGGPRARGGPPRKIKAEQLARERAARRADPMAWVRTLDPMSERRLGISQRRQSDGSWAIFSSTHQFKRSGQVVTVWLRHEYAEPQLGNAGPYLSEVEKAQYDCKKEQARDLLAVYYAANNVQGSQQTEEADRRTRPGTRSCRARARRRTFLWACAQARERWAAQMNGSRASSSRSIRARADQDLHLAGLEHGLEIRPEKTQFGRC